MIKVSIVVPVYNVEKYLKRCLDTLINQTLQEIEIILVDDGSPDNCPVICDDYAKKDNRVKVIHKQNQGLGYARNSGMLIARGEYIAFIDSDDYIDWNMMKILYELAIKKRFNAVYCGHYYERNGYIVDKIKEVEQYKEFIGKQDCRKIVLEMIGGLHKGNPQYTMSVWHAIYNLQLLRSNNISFCSEREFISEDMIFDIDFFNVADRVASIPECYYYYCANENSLSQSFKEDLYYRRRIHYLEILNRLSKNGYSSDELCVAHKHFILATQFYLFQASSICNRLQRKNAYNKVFNDHEIWKLIRNSRVNNILSIKQYIYYFCFVHKLEKLMFLINKVLLIRQSIQIK